MLRSMLKSKIHRATITDADLNYEGSLTIDSRLMEAADLFPFEQILVYNISNGNRFDTYVIEGKRGSGSICLNGAAARKGAPGDLIIIASYGLYSKDQIAKGKSILVWVDAKNKLKDRTEVPWQSP
ncbi:MAG: aspartate 1-decarboxylase [Deltaproteobacteria bacterium]|nr:aspartate 1-decarboxylase [Deltaproteobacteria bacterium]MCD6198323.1 aspartate 1-decarboxylase [Deltaproteobacteria bacterium]